MSTTTTHRAEISVVRPSYVYLPYMQVHIPPIPDPEYAGKTKRGNWGNILTQMDDFTGVILDKLDEPPDPSHAIEHHAG